MTFEQTIAQFIREQRLMRADARYVVALSGGADSVALLLVLLHLGYRVEAAHCNFNLRGDESRRDETFVEHLCAEHRVPLHRVHFDTRAYAALHHVGIETAARDLRYNYFEQLRRDLEADAVCVAHHQDDSVETMLHHLLRGTGLRGLTGISPRNDRHIVRPLLCVDRRQIEAWLAAKHQSYVTDSTNLQPDVVRNRLRLNVIPELRRAMPTATAGILTTARRLAEVQRVYDAAMARYLQPVREQGSVDVDELSAMPSAESLLYEWLTPAGFSPATIDAIHLWTLRQQSATDGDTHEWRSATHVLTAYGGRLLLDAVTPPPPTLRLPEAGTYVYGDRRLRLTLTAGATVSRQPQVATLDADRLRFPLTLRPTLPGDRLQPYGMGGRSKLVSDYLCDHKMLPADRRRQLVLADAEGHIAWLVGLRTDQRFAVGENTTKTLTVTLSDS